MRFEPANSKYFAQEICSPSFTDSLRLLGCFDETIFGWRKSENVCQNENDVEKYEKLFMIPINDLPFVENMTRIESACLLMRLLYEMAIDILDKPTSNSKQDIDTSVNPSGDSSIIMESSIVVYSCIINSMFQLIPFIPSQGLCCFLVKKVGSLFSLERNLQVMCDIGLVTELLNCTYLDIFLDEDHPLHFQIQCIFEKLSSHHIHPKELRFKCLFFNILNLINIYFLLQNICASF